MTLANGKSKQTILRWAGGKQRWVRRLYDALPDNFDEFIYVEPFLGAGSLFFWSIPRRAVLADANEHLIRAFEQVRDQPAVVSNFLGRLAKEDSEETYYHTRDAYNSLGWSASQAARFLYLNRTCFNGIFRVNRFDEFNVPYGYKAEPLFPTPAQIRSASDALQAATIRHECFRGTLLSLPKDAFVYLDPPYPPLNRTSFFAHYTYPKFLESDQRDLAEAVRDMDRSGVPFMMTNADTPLVRKLYRGFDLSVISVTRFITFRNIKHQVKELVIRNY